MQFLKQKEVLPDAGDQYFDCYKTALACILDVGVDTIPSQILSENGSPTPESSQAAVDWAAEKGIAFVSISVYGLSLADTLQVLGYSNPALIYLIIGKDDSGSSRVAVCHGAQIIWDPSLKEGSVTQTAHESLFYLVTLSPLYCIHEGQFSTPSDGIVH